MPDLTGSGFCRIMIGRDKFGLNERIKRLGTIHNLAYSYAPSEKYSD